jgi:hypothetical protein
MSEPPAGVPYKDRSAGMVFFGVLELLMALVCLLGLAVIGVGLATGSALPQGAPAYPARTLAPSLAIYPLLAAFFAAIGIGSILPRRWARTLMLIVSCLWLLAGLMAVLFIVVIVPDFFQRLAQLPGGDAQTAEVVQAVQGCMFVLLALLYVILPGIFLSFYSGRNVKATFEARDPVTRWTDRCPTPVLALSLVLGYGAFSMLLTAVFGAVPVFGRVLTGLPAILLMVVLAGMLAVLSRATYRLEPWSWWAVAGFWLLGALSTGMLAAGGLDWKALYSQMGIPFEEVDKLGLLERLQGPRMLALVAAWVVGSLAYLLWVKRFFRPPQPPAPQP